MLQPLPTIVADHLAKGALFAINHSGGKDSQAMTLLLRQIIPADQIVIVHATLGAIEWPGTMEQIEATTDGLPLMIAEAKTDFFAMVRRRKRFPTPAIRQCTSDLKRGPIERELRRYLKANPRFEGRIVSCIGMRSDESPARRKRLPVKHSARNSKAGRNWIDWLPIHHLTTRDVFKVIRNAGQQPHWVYAEGLSRCSCSFCIMASKADLKRAAELRPELAARYSALEEEVGHRLRPNRKPLMGPFKQASDTLDKYANRRVLIDDLTSERQSSPKLIEVE